MKTPGIGIGCVLLAGMLGLPAASKAGDADALFLKSETMIPPRDGARLHTVNFVPHGAVDDEKSLREHYWHPVVR